MKVLQMHQRAIPLVLCKSYAGLVPYRRYIFVLSFIKFSPLVTKLWDRTDGMTHWRTKGQRRAKIKNDSTLLFQCMTCSNNRTKEKTIIRKKILINIYVLTERYLYTYYFIILSALFVSRLEVAHWVLTVRSSYLHSRPPCSTLFGVLL